MPANSSNSITTQTLCHTSIVVRWLFCLAVVGLAACSGPQRFVLPDGGVGLDGADAQAILSTFALREERLRQVRALGAVSLTHQGRELRWRQSLAASDFHRFRLDVLPPVAAYALAIAVLKGDEGLVIKLDSKEFYAGSLTAREVLRLTGMRIAPSALVRLTLGLPARTLSPEPALTLTQIESNALLLKDNGRAQYYLVEKSSGLIQRAFIEDLFSGSPLLEVEYGWKPDREHPVWIEVRAVEGGTVLRIEIERLKEGEVIPHSVFELERPEGFTPFSM